MGMKKEVSMPRLANRPPKMSLVKSTGDAVVYVNRKRLYLGPWGSDVAREWYRQFLEAWIAADGRLPDESPTLVTISRLVVAYLEWAKPRLDRAHFHHSKAVAGFLVNLHGHTPVGKFGPKALATVQKQMETSGRFSRNYVNDLISRARTIFRWGVAQELVPETVANALKFVPPLQMGRPAAREVEPRQDVTDEVVDRTLPHLFPTVAAMVQVQRLAAMRPNEVCRMKVGEIDTTGEIWIYRPVKHKGTWRGHGKAVALGKPEQGIIAPRLTGKGPDEAVFSPKDTLAERKERDAAKRKTKVQPSQVERAKRHTENPKSRAREHYDSQSYARSIKYAIIRANRSLPAAERIPHWTPYQLRHAAVTEIALENNGNLDIARAVAGQKTISVTQRYNHADLKIAIEQAKKRTAKCSKKAGQPHRRGIAAAVPDR